MSPRQKTTIAVVFLAASSFIAFRNLILRGGEENSSASSDFIEDDLDLLDDESPQALTAKVSADLVALHGSAPSGSKIRDAFGVTTPRIQGASTVMNSGDEESNALLSVPSHHVSLTLVADQSERAVVDEAVVTIGDYIAAGEILEISKTGITVLDGNERRTYEVSEGPAFPVGYVEITTDTESEDSELKGP